MAEKRFDTAYAARELNVLGLDAEEVIGAWIAGAVTNQVTLENGLGVIRQLNAAEKGSPKILSTEFGIRNFGRYPVETLLSQLEQRNNSEDDSVVWVAAEHDPQAELYKLASRVKMFNTALGGDINLRILECETVEMAAQRLERYKERYSPVDKSVWVAHGYPKGMVLGQGEEINNDTLSSNIGQRIKSCYGPGSSTILLSCRTGTEEGFAQGFSGLLEGRVQAPLYTTSLDGISRTRVNDAWDLSVTYVTDRSMRHRDYPLRGDKAVYERGRLVA